MVRWGGLSKVIFKLMIIVTCCCRVAVGHGGGFGFEGGGQPACGRPYRSGRLYRPPCNLAKHGYCASAGRAYPWHAVKRFISDNQGLMRRMYGDQKHATVLKAELEEDLWDPLAESLRNSRFRHRDADENDVFPREDFYMSEARFLKDDIANDDVLNTKFVFSEEPIISIKLAGLKTAPHFRPTTQRTVSQAPTTTKKPEDSTTETTTATDSTIADEEDSATDSTTEQYTSTAGSTAETIVTEAVTTTATGGDTNMDRVDDEKIGDKVETMLFQDVEEEGLKKKVHVDYNIKGYNACPVKEEVVAPFWANNTRGEVLALLNMYPFEQYVHWEKCAFEHRQMYCKDGCRCEQQYRLHRLLAYDPNNECRGIFSDWFRFPSCCICKCYDMPVEFRVTSRSPRSSQTRPLNNFG
nr:unnamed protein product [Callosobruchus analis]